MYRTIESSTWDDPKVKALAPNGKLLFLYLVTNRHGHVSGIYYLPRVLVELECGIAGKALETAFNTLSSSGLIDRDSARDLVWVRKMFRHQGRGEKNCRAAARQLETLHKSFLIRRFVDCYPEVATYLRASLDALSEVGSPEQEQEQSEEREPEHGGPASPAPRRADSEIAWRVQEVWAAHLRARARFFHEANGAAPGVAPTLTPAIRQAITAAIHGHDGELLAEEQRETWKRDSRARAAGIGIFYDPFMAGESRENDARNGGKRYLEAERAWVPLKNRPDPVNRFAELYFERRAAHEAARGAEGANGAP